MKKRLTAWLLVFCMALSLLPGTAFAAEGGGDGTVTITYDLNDGISDYQLQLKTTPGQEPANSPGAKWAGRPFAGWSSDKAGKVAPDYNKDTTLYAQWLSGYTVTLDLDPTSEKIVGLPNNTKPKYTTESSGKLSADDIERITEIIQDVEAYKDYAFDGWYLEFEADASATPGTTPTKGTFRRPFGDITNTIETNGATLYAKWSPIYTITFKYHNTPVELGGPNPTPPSSETPEIPDQEIGTATGGKLEKMPPAPTYTNEPYTFEGWYIIQDTTTTIPGAKPIQQFGSLNGKTGLKIADEHNDLAGYDFTEVANILGHAITVEANWSVPFGIVFDANGGHFGSDTTKVREVIKTNQYGQLDVNNWPKNQEREGYKFLGWFKGKPQQTGKDPTGDELVGNTMFPEPTIVYAKWKKLTKVTINYDATGYDSVIRYVDPDADNEDDRKIKDLDTLLKAAGTTVKKDGYIFLERWEVDPLPTGFNPTPRRNWMTAEEVYQIAFEKDKDTIITAQWQPGYYITFDYNEADSVKDSSGQLIAKPWPTGELADTRGYLTPAQLPIPEKDGYDFAGWYIGNNKVEEITIGQEKFYNVGQATQTITAHWGPPYEIELDVNGGDMTDDSTTMKTSNDGKYLALPTPTKAGFKFIGWFVVDANGNATNEEAKAGGTCPGPVDLIAKWDDFEITLDTNGGTLPSGSTTKYKTSNGKVPILPTPTLTAGGVNLTFNGWLAPDGTQVTSSTAYNFKTDITLTADWGPNKSVTPNKVTAASKPAATASTPMLTAAEGEFDITFDPNGGSLASGTTSSAETVDKKLTALPDKPTHSGDGYKFVGWFTAKIGGKEVTTETVFPASTTIYAHWERTITFNANEGTFADGFSVAEQETTNLCLSVWPKAPERPYYKFDGWYTVATGGDKVEEDPSYKFDTLTDATLYAHWIGHTVSFARNDGSTSIVERKVTKDGKLEGIPAGLTDRTGYTFVGWFDAEEGGKQITTNTLFEKDTTVYAHWTKDLVVTFDANGGQFTDGKTTRDVTATAAGNSWELTVPPEADLTYGGHSFEAWYDAAVGGTKYETPNGKITVTENFPTTLYAHWTAAEVEITFEDYDGTEVAKLTTVNGKIPQFPNLPNRIGYKFEGWYVNPKDPTTKVDSATVFPGTPKDVTLVALWTDVTNPGPDDPQDPTVKFPVITFIVDIPTPLEDAAHFTMKISGKSGYLSQLPTLLGRDDADGWRLENGNHVDEGQLYTKDTNLYVDTAKTILITFDWNNAKDGGTSSKTTVRTDKDGKIPEDKWPDTDGKNPGYHFDNWYTEATGGTVVSKLATFKEPTTIYAHWKGPFTVTFDANGGKFPDGETTKGVETDDDGNLDPTKIPADPTREGYTKFGGWSLTKDGAEAVEPDAQPYTGAATLYAIWGPPYAIAYDAMGGEVTPTEEQKLSTEDGKFPELPVPTHPRDSFGGWYTTKDYQEGTLVSAGGDCPGAVTLYAKWTREPPYTITFEANNADATMEDPASGQPVATITLKTDDKGVLMQAPPEPTLRGGKFQGWYTKAEEGAGELISDAATRTYTDDMTLYAHWETREFTITFDFNLGAIMSNPLTITTFTTTKGKSLTFLPDTLPQAASGNYKIKGWYRVQNPVEGKDQPVTTSSTFDRDTTLYAQWELAADLPITFKYPNVTFLDAENGNALVTLEVDKDYKMSSVPPGPYKEGQTFSGWFYREPDRPDGEEKQFTKDTEVTGSLRVYPKYVGAGFTITFEPGEESELEPIKVKTTSEGRIPDGEMPSPTWEGHTFTGWFTAAEGGTKINRRTVFTQDTTVYAHWDKDDSSEPGGPDDPGEDKPGPTSPPYTITFNPNGGNLNASTTALTDLNGRLMSLPTPARTGYSFDGWFNGSERITTATVFTANTTIMAQWSTGSGGSGGNGSGDINGYAITVSNTSGGRVSVSTTYAREGDRVTVTVRPYSGYQLDRIEVTNARGYDVDLRDQGSNRYVFYMPASRVTVDAVFMELIANNGNGGNTGNTGSTGGNTGGNTNWNPGGTVTQPSGGASSGMGIFSQPVLNTVPMPYLDVHPSDWYYSSVDYMWQRQLMGGVSNNRFGPQATTSNAMVWTILARLAGVDVTSGASVWYENARSWAVSNRISDGVGPNSAVTREQLATMLWNFKGSPAVGYDLGQFGDRGQISTYQAECALSWAVANNIVTGTANRLNPRGTATRAEVAAMITRFCQNT